MFLYATAFTDPSSNKITPNPLAAIAHHTISHGECRTVGKTHSLLNRSPFLRRTFAPPSISIRFILNYDDPFAWFLHHSSLVERIFAMSKGFFGGRRDCNPMSLSRCSTVLVAGFFVIATSSSFNFEADWNLFLAHNRLRWELSRSFNIAGLPEYVRPSFPPESR